MRGRRRAIVAARCDHRNYVPSPAGRLKTQDKLTTICRNAILLARRTGCVCAVCHRMTAMIDCRIERRPRCIPYANQR